MPNSVLAAAGAVGDAIDGTTGSCRIGGGTTGDCIVERPTGGGRGAGIDGCAPVARTNTLCCAGGYVDAGAGGSVRGSSRSPKIVVGPSSGNASSSGGRARA